MALHKNMLDLLWLTYRDRYTSRHILATYINTFTGSGNIRAYSCTLPPCYDDTPQMIEDNMGVRRVY